MIPKLKIGDIITIIVVLAVGFSPLLMRRSGRATSYSIYVSGKKITTIPARGDTVFSVNGAMGKMIIQMKNGKIRVIHSNCPEKICIRTGFIYKTGQSIACVPNKLIIVAEGKGKGSKYDGILR